MEFSGHQLSKQELNVAPLVDIVFLLLIFSTLMHRCKLSKFAFRRLAASSACAVDLMLKGDRSTTVVSEEPLIVRITTDGTIRLNGLRLSLAQLRTEIAERIKGSETREVTIKAETTVSVQALVHLMDQIRRAGVNSLLLATPEKN